MRAPHQRHVPAEGPSCSYHFGANHVWGVGRSRGLRPQAGPFQRPGFPQVAGRRKVSLSILLFVRLLHMQGLCNAVSRLCFICCPLPDHLCVNVRGPSTLSRCNADANTFVYAQVVTLQLHKFWILTNTSCMRRPLMMTNTRRCASNNVVSLPDDGLQGTFSLLSAML